MDQPNKDVVSRQHHEIPQQQTANNYISSVCESFRRQSFLPSYEIKYELSGVKERLLEEKDKVEDELRQQRLLEETINEEEMLKYRMKKKQYQQTIVGVEILKKVKAIMLLVEQQIIDKPQQRNNSAEDKKPTNALSEQQLIKATESALTRQSQSFSALIRQIETFTVYYYEHRQLFVDEGLEVTVKEGVDRQFVEFLERLYCSVMDAAVFRCNGQQVNAKRETILTRYQLPLKRNEKLPERKSLKLSIDDKLWMATEIHNQACSYALYNYLTALHQANNNSTDKPSLISNYLQKEQLSPFMSSYIKKLQSSIRYLFIGRHESHNPLEPQWMFQYIQEVFTINYQWIRDQVLDGFGEDTQGNVLVYVLQYAVKELFFDNIKSRLETDLADDTVANDPLFYYKFIDSVYQLQERLNITFSQQFSLVETILVQFQLKKQVDLLKKCFDYEHKWIEQKIFKDFWQNINYSSIDLKNIETYNIVVNFNVLFEKLYTKFSSTYEPELVRRIRLFYEEQVRNLVAHIKTSLERIFYHSGLDKLSVILAFKRVQNEFRSGLSVFISNDLQFQKEIKKQYYDYIVQLFGELAVQAVSVFQRKMLKIVTEYQRLFSQQECEINGEERQGLLGKVEGVYKKWSSKLEQLNMVYAFKDAKIKNQFFVFLQSINFTQKGIMLFLSLYEPFLKSFYSGEGYNILKMVILMDKKEQQEYLKLNNSMLGFLLETELNAIRRMKMQ